MKNATNILDYSLTGRLFRYINGLDIYKIEKVNIEGRISLEVYNLIAEKRISIPYSNLRRLKFFDKDSDDLAKAIDNALK